MKLDPLETTVQAVSFVKLRVGDARYYVRGWVHGRINDAVGWWLQKINSSVDDDRY